MFSKGPPPSMFSKKPLLTSSVNFGKKIRYRHSPIGPNAPRGSSNFASCQDFHKKSMKRNNHVSFHVPGHDTTNFDTSNNVNVVDDSVPMYCHNARGLGTAGSDRHYMHDTNQGHDYSHLSCTNQGGHQGYGYSDLSHNNHSSGRTNVNNNMHQ